LAQAQLLKLAIPLSFSRHRYYYYLHGPISAMSSDNAALVIPVSSWMVCSVGCMVFNKLAIKAFPAECTLVALQMGFTAIVVTAFGWKYIHIGSTRDVMKWSLIIPFYVGMLLTSILALHDAPMTLVITFRAFSPVLSLLIEQFYPDPMRVSLGTVASIGVMGLGAAIYTTQLPKGGLHGLHWVMLNMFFAVGDRLLQRLMLAKDQCPVDISKEGCTLLNNVNGMIPLFFVALATGEFHKVPGVIHSLDAAGWATVLGSCVVGCGISYTGIVAQSLISATSFLVLVNANKFLIIFIEAYIMRTKSLGPLQLLGAAVTIAGGILYGKAREAVEATTKEERAAEKQPILSGEAHLKNSLMTAPEVTTDAAKKV